MFRNPLHSQSGAAEAPAPAHGYDAQTDVLYEDAEAPAVRARAAAPMYQNEPGAPGWGQTESDEAFPIPPRKPVVRV